MTRATATASVSSPLGSTTGTEYRLKSDIAQFCLPAANRDENRKLAYVNSLCVFYLLVGVLGLRNPFLITREPVRDSEIVPVIFTPPESTPPPQEPQPEEPQPQADTPIDTPVVATVVAADPSQVSFAVPVEGPVIFAPAKFAQPPPPSAPRAPTQPTRFVRNNTDGGYYPPPTYSAFALRQRMEGTVVLWIAVDAAGKVLSTEIKQSSGYGILDRAAEDVVKEKWRFPPGQNRLLSWECEFRYPR